MSHVATVSVVITDLNALKLAVAELGGQFVEGQKTYQWYGESVGDYPLPKGMTEEDLGKCDHVIRVPGVHYEIGVVKLKDGTGYTLAYDFYGSGGTDDGQKLLQKFGDGCKKLTQMYSVHKASLLAKKQGYNVQRTTKANGKILLTCTGGRM
jgi:hypothetical protein